jgi:hypothetical protein
MNSGILDAAHRAEHILSLAPHVEVLKQRREEIREFLKSIWSPVFYDNIRIGFADDDDIDEEYSRPFLDPSNANINYRIMLEDEGVEEWFNASLTDLVGNFPSHIADARHEFSYCPERIRGWNSGLGTWQEG